MTLYELTDELLMLLTMAEDGEEEEAFADTWEAVSGDFDEKIENYCKVIKQMEADGKAIKDEEARLYERRKRIENRVEWMKANIMTAMNATGKKKAGGTLFTASVRNKGGKLPLILDCDESDVPFEFQKVKIMANNEAIRDALDAGRELEFAHYGERGQTLNIG